MSICKTIFHKEIYELSIDDIINFFSVEQEESSILEFKTGEVDITKLFSEISAFLNTDGGLLIYGSPREVKIDGVKKCVGEPVPSTIKSQDKLLHSIASNIVPSPASIYVKSIDFKDGMIYILEIPQSNNRPHQVSNEGKYYIRFERESKPAPHGIVQSLMSQRKPIELRCEVQIMKEDNPLFKRDDTYFVSIQITNRSFYPAKGCEMYVSFVGNVKNVAEDDFGLKRKLLHRKGMSNLYNVFNASGTIVPHIWWTRNFQIIFRGDFFYLQVIFWSNEAPVDGILYKYYNNGSLEQYDMYEDSDMQKEYYSWIRNEGLK